MSPWPKVASFASQFGMHAFESWAPADVHLGFLSR